MSNSKPRWKTVSYTVITNVEHLPTICLDKQRPRLGMLTEGRPNVRRVDKLDLGPVRTQSELLPSKQLDKQHSVCAVNAVMMREYWKQLLS